MKIKTLVLGGLENNCYLLICENSALAPASAILIDAAADADRIIAEAEKLGASLKKIIITHGHYDHIGALSKLVSKTGAEVIAHKNCAGFLGDGNLNLASDFGRKAGKVKVDTEVDDGDIIHTDDGDIKVLYTPGHTSDSISLLYNNYAFVGDLLFYRSVGRTDFPTGNMQTEINSIKKKIMTLDDSTVVYPGHGPATNVGDERKYNPYLYA